jgi:hypothetical protein
LPYRENLTCVNDYSSIHRDAIVITQPYALNEIPCERNVIAFGNPKVMPDLPYPLNLLKEFCSFAKFDFQSASESHFECMRTHSNNRVVNPAKKMLISPFISSGRFRDLFGFKKRQLVKYASQKYHQENYEIYLIGSIQDNILLPFPVIDLRGVSLLKLIDLIHDGHISMGVGFDNFWMHVCDIFDVFYLVMFRGRVSRFGKLLHFKSVNISFQRGSKRIYLTQDGERVLK